MANKRIIDLTATTTPSGYVALDHETNGTKKLDVTKISPVDSTLSSSSTNAVQNKVINTALSGKLATNGNSQNNTVAFTSGDVANDAAATSWTANVATLATGLTHANLFNRISTMMKNVRYLYNAVTKLNTDKFSLYRTTLTSGSDLNEINTIDKAGAYGIASGVANCPLPWSSLIAIPSSGGMHQIIYNVSAVYVRSYTGNPLTWGSWVQVPTMDDLKISTHINTIAVSAGTLAANHSYRNGQVAVIHIRATGVTISAWESLISGLPTIKRLSEPYYVFGQITTGSNVQRLLGFTVYNDNTLHPWETISDATIDLMFSYIIA